MVILCHCVPRHLLRKALCGVYGALYSVLGIMIFVRRDQAHNVMVYHGKATISCYEEGLSCISSFDVIPMIHTNVSFMFGSCLILASVISTSVTLLHKPYSITSLNYIDAVVVNPLLTSAIAVITGSQELSTVLLLGLICSMYEFGILIHDMAYWSGEYTSKYNFKARVLLLLVLAGITWALILAALFEFWTESNMPGCIPGIGVVGFLYTALIRYLHVYQFYSVIPAKIRRYRVNSINSSEVVPLNASKMVPSRYEVMVREEKDVLEWYEEWREFLNFISRFTMVLMFYIGTSETEIEYI